MNQWAEPSDQLNIEITVDNLSATRTRKRTKRFTSYSIPKHGRIQET